MSVKPVGKPNKLPDNPSFSCGPAAKIPGWSVEALRGAAVGRSHRTSPAKERIAQVGDEIKALLELPDDYVVATMAGSDTGAIEAAMWSMLGPRPVDVFAWEAFGIDWAIDAVEELKPLTVRTFIGEYGVLPPIKEANFDHDVIFTWNGTAAGVKVPDDASWIPDDRKGLTICDATSAILGMPIPWHKLDVITFSWQKMLGGEAQHGALIIGPRAAARLQGHRPPWPVPKIYRLCKNGEFQSSIFEGNVINTPSLLCVEDVLVSMAWARSQGGLNGLIKRCRQSFKYISDWVERTPWVEFLCSDPVTRSNTSVCLKFCDPEYSRLSEPEQRAFCARLVSMIGAEGAGYDFNAYKDAPPGLRIWCGATVEPSDVNTLLQWIDWAFAECHAMLIKQAA